tara:strand:- start:108 stop:476 length:369 start_codon:yes stop_codon:yes gene_type:complete
MIPITTYFPNPPKNENIYKQKNKNHTNSNLLQTPFMSQIKIYNLLDLEIDFIHNIMDINLKLRNKYISNEFIFNRIENYDLQLIEYVLSEINLYIEKDTSKINVIIEYIEIINNIFEKSKKR